MKTAVVIPARYASTRLPGKPLLRETGKYLVQHVYERACLAPGVDVVVVATDERTIDLFEREGVLAPVGLVGIDLDPARIDGFRRRRPNLKWVAGNLYERLETPELANVGVLNLDAYGEVGDADGLGDFHLIRGLALRCVERFGEFVLFWNQDLDSVCAGGASAAGRCAAKPRWCAGRSRAVCRDANWRPRCCCPTAARR